MAWQQKIFEVLDSSTLVVSLYSPDFVKSKVCQEEFNIAWARNRKCDGGVIYPIYWRTGDLPTYMRMLNFADCREREKGKLEQTCGILTGRLRR